MSNYTCGWCKQSVSFWGKVKEFVDGGIGGKSYFAFTCLDCVLCGQFNTQHILIKSHKKKLKSAYLKANGR